MSVNFMFIIDPVALTMHGEYGLFGVDSRRKPRGGKRHTAVRIEEHPIETCLLSEVPTDPDVKVCDNVPVYGKLPDNDWPMYHITLPLPISRIGVHVVPVSSGCWKCHAMVRAPLDLWIPFMYWRVTESLQSKEPYHVKMLAHCEGWESRARRTWNE